MKKNTFVFLLLSVYSAIFAQNNRELLLERL